MMRRRQWLASAASGVAVAACGGRHGLSIGFLAPLSGRRADLGEGGRNGALLAIESANTQGGSGAGPLQLLVEDDQLDPRRAATGFARMQAMGMVALVGAYTKPIAEAVGPLAAAVRIPVISPNLGLLPTLAGDLTIFRMNRTTRDNAQAYARQLLRAGQRRLAVISEISSIEFVHSWLSHFGEALQTAGAEVCNEVSYTAGADTRFSTLVDRALAQPCDGVLLIAPTVDVARLCQQLRRRSPRLPLATIDRNGTPELLQLGGRAVEGLLLLQAFNPQDQGARFLDFVARYRQRFGELPGQSAVVAHDAIAVLHQALQAGAGQAPLLQRLLAGGPFQGLQQRIAFDEQGSTERQAWFVQVREGRFQTIGPA